MLTKDKNEPKPKNAALSEKLDEFFEALGILYVKNNISGRNKFREKWPDAALHIFGEELIHYDNEGVKDREHRDELEKQAEKRRLALKTKIIELHSKSVLSGALQFDYVGEIIDHYGMNISLLIYKEDIIERVRPELLKNRIKTKEPDTKDSIKKNPPETNPASPSNTENKNNELDENIRPIETPVPTDMPTPSASPDAEEPEHNEQKPKKGYLMSLFNPLAA